MKLVPGDAGLDGGFNYQDRDHLEICSQNALYNPPLVLFEEGRKGQATLTVRVDEVTSRTQFLVHYSFTPEDNKDGTGIQIKGGTRNTSGGEGEIE